jgi:hypothetical protein
MKSEKAEKDYWEQQQAKALSQIEEAVDHRQSWEQVVSSLQLQLDQAKAKLQAAVTVYELGVRAHAEAAQQLEWIARREAGGVTTTRVDPETEGPVPTLLAHFPISWHEGWLCSCQRPDQGPGPFITKQQWAEHTMSQLWDQMQEEPF